MAILIELPSLMCYITYVHTCRTTLNSVVIYSLFINIKELYLWYNYLALVSPVDFLLATLAAPVPPPLFATSGSASTFAIASGAPPPSAVMVYYHNT